METRAFTLPAWASAFANASWTTRYAVALSAAGTSVGSSPASSSTSSPCDAVVVDERPHVTEAGRGRHGRSGTEGAEHSAQVGIRGARGHLDCLDGVGRSRAVGSKNPSGGRGLDPDDADLAGHGVVELARQLELLGRVGTLARGPAKAVTPHGEGDDDPESRTEGDAAGPACIGNAPLDERDREHGEGHGDAGSDVEDIGMPACPGRDPRSTRHAAQPTL